MGFICIFVNKHLSSWQLLGLQDIANVVLCLYLTLYHTIPIFNDLVEEGFGKNTVGKGENAGNQHFLLFPQCFLPYQSSF